MVVVDLVLEGEEEVVEEEGEEVVEAALSLTPTGRK